MAHSLKDLEGWEIITTDGFGNIIDNTQKRRRHRRNEEELVYLQRKSDGLRFGRGDNIIMNDEKLDTYSIYLVHDIRLNTLNNVVELWALTYLRWFELDPVTYYSNFEPKVVKNLDTREEVNRKMAEDVDKNELYFTLQPAELKLSNFISLAKVSNFDSWLNDTEEKDLKKEFFVRYIFSPISDNVVPINLIEEIPNMLKLTPKEAQEYIKDIAWPKKRGTDTSKELSLIHI